MAVQRGSESLAMATELPNSTEQLSFVSFNHVTCTLDERFTQEGICDRRVFMLREALVVSEAIEREEWRCLLVARLRVCSISERGAGGGRTSSRWLARGVGGRGQLARIGSSRVDASLVALRCLLSVALSARWRFSPILNTVTAATHCPIRSSASVRPPRSTGNRTLVTYNSPLLLSPSTANSILQSSPAQQTLPDNGLGLLHLRSLLQ